MCFAVRSVSDMFHCKSDKDVVELFCSRTCVTSYKLRPAIAIKSQAEKNKKRKRGRQPEQQSDTEEGNIPADSTENQNDAAVSGVTSIFTITNSWVVCGNCGKKLSTGQTIYQPPNSAEVFCSGPCLSERHPHIKIDDKKCYNCLKVIQRPHDIILAPVDDSGNMRELCSNACLSSVQSRSSPAPKPPPASRSSCTMCSRFLVCKFKLTLDGLTYKLCSNACLVNYQKVNKLSMFPCEVCSSFSVKSWLQLKMDDGNKTICSEECLVKFKQKIDSPRLCPMCQTTHQMSDMVESKNDDGVLDFFCSNRCVLVHKAQSVTASGSTRLSLGESDIKEVKPPPAMDCKIKEESTNDEYNQNLPLSVSTVNIKDEPNVAKDLKICSVVSVKSESAASTAPTLAHMDLPASCSNCKTVLMDGETVYQRKSHTDIFCSSSCLLKFYQMKQVKKTCHYCLQLMTESQDVLQAPVDPEGTVKDFCSQTCLSSFSYKKIMSTKIPIMPLPSQSQCSMCNRYCISKHEVIQEDVVHKLCSDPCFNRFCNMKDMFFCKNCHSRCREPLVLKTEDGSKTLCSAECLAQFKQKTETPQTCAMCCTSHLMSEMVENKNSENVVELFCTSSCVMASKIQAVSASGIPLDCDKCGKNTVPACHLAMSDASIRNFCSLSCAMAFKETQKNMNAASNTPGTSDKTQCDFLKPPEKLPCAQCRRILKATPKVVQKKGKMNFVCTLACSREFKRVNNILGKCEYCKNERIIRDAKRIDGKDCYFCSDSCKMLFRLELEKKWGDHCHMCAYCRCVSKTVVTAQYDGTKEDFCSEECNSKYNMLFCHLAKCDTCGHEGKLRQSLPMLGEVKYFCDLKCVLHFCNKKVQMVNTVSSPPRSASTASSPVIANVISLASALARQPRASASSAQLSTQTQTSFAVPDIQTKVVGHVSTQTVPKELKNKSVLCTPLVHNKGVSCLTQTVDAETQTDKLESKVIILPVPVPMSMNSPSFPLPVSKLLPEASVKPTKEPVEKNETDERQEDRAETKEGHKQKIKAATEHHSICGSELPKDHQDVNMLEDSFTDAGSQHAPPFLETGRPSDTNKSPNVLPVSEAAEEETSLGDFSRKYHTLKSHRGIDTWNRWLQARESQINQGTVLSQTAMVNQDVLDCSVTELCDSLCRFIAEVRRPDGKLYSPDSLYYVCLCIQQYLFENGRLENIFSDQIYNNFSTEFTKILKAFKPAITSSGHMQSCVEEEFLWDCKQLGAYSPIVLLNTLLFFCCKYFGFTTVEQHRQLSFANIRCITKTNEDDTETTVLRFYPPTPINEEESDADSSPAKKQRRSEKKRRVLEMTENSENPLRCPVSLYKFYLSKCSQSVRQRTDLFYLQPDQRRGASSPLWFHSVPVDESTMEAMLVRILAVRGLQEADKKGLEQQTHEEVEG